MQKLLQFALITGSLLTGKLFAASEHKEPEAASAAAPAYPVVTQATWSPEQRDLFNAVLAGDLSTVQRLHREHSGILQTRFSGEFDGLPYNEDCWTSLLNQHTILHIAAFTNSVTIIEWLLGAHYFDIDVRCGRGSTPLMQAAMYNRLDAVKILMVNHANTNAEDYRGRSAIELLVKHMSSVLFNVSFTTYVATSEYPIYPVATQETWSPEEHSLFYAIADDNLSAIKELVVKNPRILQTRFQGIFSDYSGLVFYNDTILHIAAFTNSVTIINWLLKNHHFDIDVRCSMGSTTLMQAAMYNRLDAAKTLVSHGADINAKSRRGETALQLAVNRKHNDIYNFIIKKCKRRESI